MEVPIFEETNSTEILQISQLECPKTGSLFPGFIPDEPEWNVLIYRPATPEGTWPEGRFNFLPFIHGNGQGGTHYDSVLRHLASNGGFVVASLVGDGNGGPTTRRARLLCVAEAFLDGNTAWSGTGKLSGRYAFMGHSTGGLGAFGAAAAVQQNTGLLGEHELVAVAAIAPNNILPSDPIFADFALIGADSPDFFVLQGTGDGDTSGAAFSNYDRALPSLTGSTMDAASRKAMIWAYDVEHNEYGGRTDALCLPSEKAVALTNTYLGGFLRGSFYEDPESLDLFFRPASPLIPPAISDPQLGFWTEFGGAPQVYGTSSQQVRPARGYKGHVIDSFENGDVALSDGGLNIAVSSSDMYAELDLATVLDSKHLTRAGVFAWTGGDKVTWALDLDTRVALTGATSLTFRAGVAVDVIDPQQCSGVSGELPALVLHLFDGELETELDLTPYGRLSLPEARDELLCDGLQGDGCHAWDVMQTTFRIPLSDLCGSAPGLLLSEVNRLGLSFRGTEGILLLDDVEIRRVPGEPNVTCRCAA